jgi:hypothetical protein
MSSTTLATLGLAEAVTVAQGSDINYSDLVQTVQTFGRVFLPSVYGKDLSAFEIASSGKIVLSLNDCHAVDVAESGGTVTFKPAQSNMLQLAIPSDAAHVTLNPFAESVDVGGAAVFVTGNDIVKVSTSNDLATVELASSNITLAATSTITMQTPDLDAYVSLDAASNNINMYSSNDLTIHSQHEVLVRAKALRIHVDEFDLSYSFRPTSTGALSLIQTVPDANGNLVETQVAKFGVPLLL